MKMKIEAMEKVESYEARTSTQTDGNLATIASRNVLRNSRVSFGRLWLFSAFQDHHENTAIFDTFPLGKNRFEE